MVNFFSANNKIFIIDMTKLLFNFKDDIFDMNYYYVPNFYFSLSFYKFYSNYLIEFILNLYTPPKSYSA